MKTLILTTALLITSIFATAGNKGEGSSEILHVDGKAMVDDKGEGKVLVSIYADGALESQFFTNKRGDFDYYLDANTIYDIKFEKEGYASKTVKFNTYAQKVNLEFYEFGFNVDMETEDEAGEKEVVAAEVSFNKKRRRFMYSRPILF